MKKQLQTPGSPIQPKHLLFILCISVCLPRYVFAQEPTSKPLAELKKDAETAKKAAEDEIKKTDYDCDKILEAIQKIKDAKEDIEAQKPSEPTPPPDNATAAAKNQYKKDKAAFDAAKKEYDNAIAAADRAAAAARKCAHGLATSDEIVAKLEEMRKKIDKNLSRDDQNRINRIIDELIEAAKTSAAENPCGPTEVLNDVNEKLADIYEDYSLDDDPKIRELIKKWFEDNFEIDVTGTGAGKRKQPRMERDSKGNRRQGLTHISIHPSGISSGPYFSLAGGALFPLAAPNDVMVDATELHNSLFQPELFGALYEKLGGEFVPGDISGTQTDSYRLSGTTSLLPALSLGWGLGNGMEFDTRLYYFRQQWKGAFPVTVFSQQHQTPNVETGQLNAKASGLLAEMNASWVFGSGRLQGYLRGGLRAQWPLSNESSGDLAGIAIPVDAKPIGTQYSATGGAGMRLGLGRAGFAELGGQFGKGPGAGYAPAVEARIGWIINGKKPAKKPATPPISRLGRIDDASMVHLTANAAGEWTELRFSMAINPGPDALEMAPELIVSSNGKVVGRYQLSSHGINSGICCGNSEGCGEVPEGFSRYECTGPCTDLKGKQPYECVLFKDMALLLPGAAHHSWSVEAVLPAGIQELYDPLHKNNLLRTVPTAETDGLLRVPVDCPQAETSYTLEVCATSAANAEAKAVTHCRGKYVCDGNCSLKVSATAGIANGDCAVNGEQGKMYDVKVTFRCE